MPRWWFQEKRSLYGEQDFINHVSVGCRPHLSDIPNWEIQTFDYCKELVIVEACPDHENMLIEGCSKFHKPVRVINNMIENVVDTFPEYGIFSWHHGPEHSWTWPLILGRVEKKAKLIMISCPLGHVTPGHIHGQNLYDEHPEGLYVGREYFDDHGYEVFLWREKWGMEINAIKRNF